MNILLSFVFLLIVCFVTFLVYKFNNNVPLSSLLADNGFQKRPETTEDVREFVMALLTPFSIIDTYQGTEAERWDESSWFITVDPGGEDPPIRLLTWEQHTQNLPNCVIGRCIGVRKINKLIGLMTRNSFQQLDLTLLPQEHQPYLAKQKGLLLYAEKGSPLADKVDEPIFHLLNKPELNISFAHYHGRICCWTWDLTGFDTFFNTCTSIKSTLQQK